MEESKMIRFRFKSAFFFISFAVVANLLFIPPLMAMGLSKEASLFILNSMAGSIGVTIVMLYFEGKYRNRRHAVKFFLGSLLVCALACYYLVYL